VTRLPPDKPRDDPRRAPRDDPGFGPPAADLTPRQAALRTAAFRLLLETARPVPPDRLAAALGEDLAGITADLLVLAERGRIRLAGQDVLASLGLTLVATHHQIGIDGARWHTWCALDALGILGALAVDSWIRSANPATGQHFHITIAGGVPRSAGVPPVLFMAGQAPVASVIDQWCPLVNFFTSRESALSWAAQSGVSGRCFDLADAFPLATALWQPLVGAAAR
jgi:Alkylmercury lyase